MNIFKWLKDKAGKLPVTIAQAAGLTAVVGAAGFAALNYLSGPSDNNNTFIPPSAYEQGDVVYVAQGPGSYDADGAAGSTFKAAPSRSIRLANQQESQMRQAQELEGFMAQPTFEEPPATPKLEGRAHELSGGEMGLGMGSNKQIGNSFEILKNMPDQFGGLGDAISQATAKAGANTPGAQGPAAPGTPAAAPRQLEGNNGQSAATLASASRNWGKGGLTRAGGGSSGSGSSFVVQDSGKNKGGSNAAPGAQEMAQAGDAIAQARSAMGRMREGETLTSRANFGPSDGLSGDRNASVRNARKLGGKGANELAMIRKQSAAISANRTNAANAGTLPFMSGAQISGGLVVSQDNVVIGQSASSGDLGGRSTSRGQMKGIQAKLDEVQTNFDEQELSRDSLKDWLLQMAMVAVPAIIAVACLVAAARVAVLPWVSIVLYILAAILTLVTAAYIWIGTIRRITEYNATCGADWWNVAGWGLATLLTGGLGLAWFLGPSVVGNSVKAGWAAIGGLIGMYSPGKGLIDELKALKNKGDTPSTEEEDPAHQTADEEK